MSGIAAMEKDLFVDFDRGIVSGIPEMVYCA
jgi:hypothetical protein